MKLLEPKIKELLGKEALSTPEITALLFPDQGDWKVKHETPKVYSALASMQEKGLIESRMCRPDGASKIARYWALPGGTFPKPAEKTLVERILCTLTDEPMGIDVLFPQVYSDYTDRLRAMQNLNKTLNRLKADGFVERASDELHGSVWVSTWRLRQ